MTTPDLEAILSPLGITLKTQTYDCGESVVAKGPGIRAYLNDRGTADCGDSVTAAGRLYQRLVESGALPDPGLPT